MVKLNSNGLIRIGLEVHAQLLLTHKLFSNAIVSSSNTSASNTFIDWFDTATPGTYPILNADSLCLAMRAAKALQCSSITDIIAFDRKHYDYPDLPHGYQITQHRYPFATHGFLNVPSKPDKIRIRQIHLEVDSAKKCLNSDFDYNRAGIGLLEIVTEPDFTDAIKVIDFLKTLRDLLRTIRVSDCMLEHGSFRVDINVSKQSDCSKNRCEIKNLNNYELVFKALEQTSIERYLGQNVTLGFDENLNLIPTRIKQTVDQYCFLPDPDIPDTMLSVYSTLISQDKMPPTPEELIQSIPLGIDARKLVSLQLAAPYVDFMAHGIKPERAYNWLNNNFLKCINHHGIDMLQADDVLPRLRDMLIHTSDTLSKEILPLMFEDKRSFTEIAIDHNLSTCKALSPAHLQICDSLLQTHSEKLNNIRNCDFFVGSALKIIASSLLSKPNPKLLMDYFKGKMHLS